MARLRLDQTLVERGLAESRQKAQALVRAGQVRVDGQVVDQPAFACRDGVEIRVAEGPRFVSRGGDKLQGALDRFGSVEIAGRVCLDCGISTGGFTDCLLQHGARRVHGIDVGYGQVAWKLRSDPRVVLHERTNLRLLTPESLYGPDDEPATLATVDISFISVRLVLPVLRALLALPHELLVLVKPQFEAGRGRVGKHGVVRDPVVHREVIAAVWEAASALGWRFQGLTGSPLTGPAGNHEYWLWLSEQGEAVLVGEQIERCVAETLAG
jgi:23S rRNA (cytidine1920-2'-O)/16S rRNA (cytidine1409-2'-O)-methyltransferase